MRTLTASALLLLVPLATATGCDSSTEPPIEHDAGRLVFVRGRVTTEEGIPLDTVRIGVQFATNSADCTGELWTANIVHPDRNGFYGGIAESPRLLAPQRCVWTIARRRIGGVLYEDTAGGIPATLRFRRSGVPLDTLTIDVVLKRRTQ